MLDHVFHVNIIAYCQQNRYVQHILTHLLSNFKLSIFCFCFNYKLIKKQKKKNNNLKAESTL